jgi:hypothetical protein
VLEVLRGIGDRKAGLLREEFDTALALGELLQQFEAWAWPNVFATAANWANSACFGLWLDILLTPELYQSI